VFFGSRLLTAAAGAVLLLAGRRVYWLIVGLVGFVVGFTLAGEYLEGPDWVTLVAGLATGLLASGLAVFFQKIAIAVAGFLIGGLAVLWWAEQMGWGEPWWVWVMGLVAGFLGSYLTRTVFEVALVVLSSVLGATFVLEALQRPVDQISPLMLILVVAGIVIQFATRRSRGSD
jgi:hypothetical protein